MISDQMENNLNLKRAFSIAYDAFPGMPRYFEQVRRFMPLTIHLGNSQTQPDQRPHPIYWQPGSESNGSLLILGGSGSGKTEALKVIGEGIVNSAIPVLVLDFHGDVIFPHLKTVFMSSGSSSVVGINPLQLSSSDFEKVGLYDQRKALLGVLRRAIPALSSYQETILHDAMVEAYHAVGIYDENPNTWGREAPSMRDVLNILEECASDKTMKFKHKSISGCISAVRAVFDHPIFQRYDHLNVEEILSSNVRVDLSKVDDSIKFIVAETLLRMVFNTLRHRGYIPTAPVDDSDKFRLFVIIDEVKILSASTGDPNAYNRILNVLATEGRKFGIVLILASQMIDHFGSEVKANISTRLILKQMDIREAKKNAADIHVEATDLANLQGHGDGYFKNGQSGKGIRIQVECI